MIFTQEDYRKIEAYLKSKGIKDTEFQFSGSLTGDEEISFIQDGRNVRTTLNKFLESFRTSNFINVTEIGPSITGRYTLQEAIDVVPKPSRTEGCIITYIDSSDDDWKLYQFLGKAIEDWYDLEMWRNILSVADTHFKGSFENEDLLYEHVPRPEVGDYAFVGLKFNESVIYRCRNRWVWSPTTEKATDYIKVVIEGNITVGPNGNWFQNGVDTGIKAEGPKGDKGDSIKGDKGDTPILRLEVDEGYVQYGYDGIHWVNLIPLSKFVINTNNTPDNEDIISDNHNQLKFADRKYSSANNINLGYKILRKNIQGGKNILSQDMLSDTNTIYVIKYDFDLNGQTINIPRRCKLLFDGGSLSNGKINSKANIENFGVDGIFTFKDVTFGSYGATLDLSKSILPTVEKEGTYGYDLSLILNTINKWKADTHYNLNITIIFPWSLNYYIKETIFIAKNVSIDFNGSRITPINPLDYCFSISSESKKYDDTDTGMDKEVFIKSFIVDDSFNTKSKIIFCADEREISDIKALNIGNTLLTYGGYLGKEYPNNHNYIDLKYIHDIKLSNDDRDFYDIVIGKGDGCRLDAIHGCRIRIEGSQGFISSNCINCGFNIIGSQGTIINHHDEEAKEYIVTNSIVVIQSSKIWKHNRHLINIQDDINYKLYDSPLFQLSKLTLIDVIVSGSFNKDFGNVNDKYYDIYYDNSKCDISPVVEILGNTKARASTYRESFPTLGEKLTSNLNIYNRDNTIEPSSGIKLGVQWRENDMVLRDMSNSKYIVIFIYDKDRAIGKKLGEVAVGQSPTDFGVKKQIPIVTISKDFSKIHDGSLYIYHLNDGTTIDYRYVVDLYNNEMYGMDGYNTTGQETEPSYYLLDTGDALNNRIGRDYLSEEDSYDECSKVEKVNYINIRAYLSALPKYGKWKIGDEIVINSIIYKYNGSKWVDGNNVPFGTLREGATSSRPTTPPDGFVYKDTTINKLIWYLNGKWYDSTGVEPSVLDTLFN